MSWLTSISVPLIAQAAEGEGQAAVTGPVATVLQFLPLIAIGLFMYFILLRPQSREAKKRDELLGSLKKDDRVVTIGGIIGTVANISSNGKEITLKMDDNNKVRFLRSAIQGKFSSEEGEGEAKPS